MVKKLKLKSTFIIKQINKKEADIKYGFNIVSNISEMNTNPHTTTLLSDLDANKDTESCVYTYLDESKQTHNCVITMADFTKDTILPKSTNIKCFWCKHNFTTNPLGCPIQWVSGKITKEYYSEITKDTYSITENISNSRKNILKNIIEKYKSKFNIINNNDDYYLVDGIFCSFNCCLAYINENRKQYEYQYSEFLLYNIYSSLFNNKIERIIPAPHWRLLQDYGGNLSINEFRNNFNTIEYKEIDDFIYNSSVTHINRIYEKKVKF